MKELLKGLASNIMLSLYESSSWASQDLEALEGEEVMSELEAFDGILTVARAWTIFTVIKGLEFIHRLSRNSKDE